MLQVATLTIYIVPFPLWIVIKIIKFWITLIEAQHTKIVPSTCSGRIFIYY